MNCLTCGRELTSPSDNPPRDSTDCGGDCYACVREAEGEGFEIEAKDPDFATRAPTLAARVEDYEQKRRRQRPPLFRFANPEDIPEDLPPGVYKTSVVEVEWDGGNFTIVLRFINEPAVRGKDCMFPATKVGDDEWPIPGQREGEHDASE